MKTNLFLTFAILLSLALVFPLVSAQGLIPPHQFYGDVSYNNAPAPNGISVVAKIDGEVVKETTTLNGKYGYSPLFFITDPTEGSDVKTVVFYVGDVESESYVFESGRSTPLNLAGFGPAINPPPSSGGGGGGGSGGGGGGGSSSSSGTTTTTSTTTSEENSEAEEEEEEIIDVNAPQNSGSSITGAVIGFMKSGTGFGFVILILVIFVVGAILVRNRKLVKK
jgi:hypothetical protein